ncbi:MAG TPA: site-2 protease family protein, partial [Aggregatilineales bacterium]|nr:site-2 protease family protein [Aggregatilineales bacterium]
MNIPLMIVVLGAVLIPLIIIHEFGHFLACKMVGISVLEFGIGFPPRLWRLFRWGETDFTINVIPLGGFVMPFGEDFLKPQGEGEMGDMERELRERGVENPKSVYSAKPWQKIWFLAAGPLANFIGAIVLFVVVGLTGAPTRVADVAVAEVFPETEAASRALRPLGNDRIPADVIIAVNGQSFNTSAELEATIQEIIDDNPDSPVTFTIKRTDPVTGESVFDTEMTPVLDVEAPEERVRILEVQGDTPAERAGFQRLDLIIRAAGEDIKTLERLQEITADNSGKEIIMTVERGSEIIDIPVTPEKIDGEGQPARIGITINKLVVAPAFGFVVDDINETTIIEKYGLIDSFAYGMDRVWTTFRLIAAFPGELLRGNYTAQEARPVSPVGVTQIGAEIIEES